MSTSSMACKAVGELWDAVVVGVRVNGALLWNALAQLMSSESAARIVEREGDFMVYCTTVTVCSEGESLVDGME